MLDNPVYEFAYRNRDEKCGGGVGIYIRDTIEFKVRNDISKLDESNLWVEIQGKKKILHVLSAYFTNQVLKYIRNLNGYKN